MPSAITQIKLANLFGISPGELMGAPAIPPEGVKKRPLKPVSAKIIILLHKKFLSLFVLLLSKNWQKW